jgi:hypothetical protein
LKDKKDAFYFSHDSNARNDPKCAALRSKYGSQGYGWFWIIIELLRDQPNYKYPINKYTFDTFAREMQCDRNAVIEFINDCSHEFADERSALLCIDENYIWSESLLRRMSGVDKKRENARNSALSRWGKEDENRNANAMPPQCVPNAKKKRKEKNIYTTEFEIFYEKYPRSEDKMRTFNNWKTCIKSFTPEQLMTACSNYIKAKAGTEKQYLKSSANFLGREKPFEDYLEAKPSDKPNDNYRRSD